MCINSICGAYNKNSERKQLQMKILIYEPTRTCGNVFQGVGVRRQSLTQMLIQGAQWSYHVYSEITNLEFNV